MHGGFTIGEGAMAEVRQGGGWRKGTESTLWVVAERDGPWAVLAAWVTSEGGEPERVEKRVPLDVLRNGREGWIRVDDEELFGPAMGAGPPQLMLAPPPPQELADNADARAHVADEARGVSFIPEGSDYEGKVPVDMSPTFARTRRELRSAREELEAVAGPTLSRAGQMLGSLVRLLQDAEGALDEAYGPTFKAWRCDECRNLLTDRQLDAVADLSRGGRVAGRSRDL